MTIDYTGTCGDAPTNASRIFDSRTKWLGGCLANAATTTERVKLRCEAIVGASPQLLPPCCRNKRVLAHREQAGHFRRRRARVSLSSVSGGSPVAQQTSASTQAQARLGLKRLSSASVKRRRYSIDFVLREFCRAGV